MRNVRSSVTYGRGEVVPSGVINDSAEDSSANDTAHDDEQAQYAALCLREWPHELLVSLHGNHKY